MGEKSEEEMGGEFLRKQRRGNWIREWEARKRIRRGEEE